MEEEKVNAFINFLVTNKENLGDNLTDELLNNVKDALGENFIYPDYATPIPRIPITDLKNKEP